VPERALELFQAYADAYARGERPRAHEYVERAGDEADELATMLDRFLEAAPARDAREEDAALLAAWLADEPPLLELRRRRGQRVDEVVDALMSGLGLHASRRAKVKDYYQRLEAGLLDPRGVSDRVWAVLGQAAKEIAVWRPLPPADEVWLRASVLSVETPLAHGALKAEPPESDEVDELFMSSAE
jgi:hypothetical protein